MYTIGQVLFVVLTKKNQVYPMQVVETITKRTLRGEEISYVLQAGSDRTSKVTLDTVDGEIFDSAEKARNTLVQRATLQINKLIDTAVSKSSEWYGLDQQPQSIKDLPDLLPNPVKKDEIFDGDDVSIVTMPDGSVVKVRLPKIASV